MSNRGQVYGRSNILRVRAQALTKQFEELQNLRDQVRKAEARAVRARRPVGRRRVIRNSTRAAEGP